MNLQPSLLRWLLVVAFLECAGCRSLPEPTSKWRGHEPERIEVVIVQTAQSLPAKAWLVKSEREGATGLVTFTKWGSGDYRYHQRAYFTLEEKWRPDVDHIGIVEGAEFCTVNPEHGGYEADGSYVITNAYDYCADLVQD